MPTSSHRVGPTYDTLRIVIQPYPDRTVYSVTRIHFDGPQATRIRLGSGLLAISSAELESVDALGLLERLVETMRKSAEGPAAP